MNPLVAFIRSRSALPAGLALLLAATSASAAAAGNQEPFSQRPAAQALIQRLADQHGIPTQRTRTLLDQAKAQPKILAAMRKPAEKVLPWHKYRKIFVQPSRAQAGAAFIRAHRDIFNRVQQRYGVPATIIAAIIGVETRYGKHLGGYRVLDALATLGFDYPERGRFFTSELEQFLVLCHEEHLDPLAAKGSYAGAMGMPQFIASSYRAYAVDFNGDGKRDLWRQPADIIASVANYFHEHGWQPGAPIAAPARVPTAAAAALQRSKRDTHYSFAELKRAGVGVNQPPPPDTRAGLIELAGKSGPEYWLGYHDFFVITSYNHSRLYAMAVYQLSQAIAAQLREVAQQ